MYSCHGKYEIKFNLDYKRENFNYYEYNDILLSSLLCQFIKTFQVYSGFVSRSRCGRDRMAVGFTNTVPVQSVPIITKICEFESCSWQGVLVQHYVINLFIFAADQWISPGTPVSSTNKTDRHYITQILLKVVLNTITLTP